MSAINFSLLNRARGLQYCYSSVQHRESFAAHHKRARKEAEYAAGFALKSNLLNEYKIFYIIRNHCIRYKCISTFDALEMGDVIQQIRLAMLENAACTAIDERLECAYDAKIIKAAWRSIRSLFRAHGIMRDTFRIICQYTNADLEQFHAQESQEVAPLATAILDYYESHTVRETCAEFGIEFNQRIARAFAKYFCKHEGNRKPTKTQEQIRQQNLLAQRRWRERRFNSHVIEQQNAESIRDEQKALSLPNRSLRCCTRRNSEF